MLPDFPNIDPERLKRIYRETAIRRVPLSGIVAGYHTLPFTVVGPDEDGPEDEEEALPGPEGRAFPGGSVKLTGQIKVSPKLVIPIGHDDDRFKDIFPESEPFMDRSLVGRIFSFAAGNKRNYRIRNEFLNVERFSLPGGEMLDKVLDEMDRREATDMGVIWCPEPRFYPVSLERFIFSVLERELK